MGFLIVIHLIWLIILLISGDLFDAPGPPDPPEPTLDDFLKSVPVKDRYKVRFINPDYDPKRGFHPHTNNPYYYPFRNYEEDKPAEVPKPDPFKTKVKILLFVGICGVLVAGIPILLVTPA